MDVDTKAPQNCRWAEPTLFLPLPYWLEAWSAPWTCRRDEKPQLIETTDACEACPRWEPRRSPAPFGTE